MIVRERFITQVSDGLSIRDIGGQNQVLKFMHNYLRHGGRFFWTRSLFNVDWIPDLLKSSEPWLVEDLGSFEICLIGTIAHVDAVFRDRIKKTLASYRSPISSSRESFAINLFESLFSVASIKSRFCALGHCQKYKFLLLLCRTGSASMVRLFLDVANGHSRHSDLLRGAAAGGNIDVVCTLLGFGAESSLALSHFLFFGDELPDEIFRRILWILVEDARPAPFDRNQDALISIICSSRALSLHPKAPEILLNRKVFSDSRFGKAPEILLNQNQFTDRVSGRKAFCGSCHDSYMYHAIMTLNFSILDLLLQNGAIADATISELFRCDERWLEQCTWITLSVHLGAAACTDVLIRHGADVTARDRTGRSAVQLAKMNALACHPRRIRIPEVRRYYKFSITAEEDAETLDIVERAFNDRFQGTKSLEDHIKSMNELPVQPPLRRKRPQSVFRKTVAKVLGTFLTASQTERLHRRLEDLYRQI